MDNSIRCTLLWIVAFICLVLGALFANIVTREPSQEQLQSLGYYRFESPRPLSDFELIDHEENPVGHSSLKNRWSLLFFGFTYCPDVCPTTLAVLSNALAETGIRPQVILVSVDPERDSPQVLARYIKSFDPEFRGYTGTFDNLIGLATQVNVAFGKVPGREPSTYSVDHSANIIVINPEGKYAGFIRSPHQPQNIRAIVSTFD